MPPRPRITMISASHSGRGPLRLPGLTALTAAGAACFTASCRCRAQAGQAHSKAMHLKRDQDMSMAQEMERKGGSI